VDVQGDVDVQIESTLIENNTAAQNGGGVAAQGTADVQIESSVIERNTATQKGGGVDAQGTADVQIESSVIERNTATQSGGGVAAQDAATVQIGSSTIESNTATLNGGGIYSADSSVTLLDSTVTHNTALNGGGIAIEGGTLALLDDQSTTCVADNYALPFEIGKGDDLYLAPSRDGTSSAVVTLNEANGTLYPGSLNIPITDWYVDGSLDGEDTYRWLDKYGNDTAYLEIYLVSDPESDSESEPAQTVNSSIEITGTIALKAAYDGLTIGGSGSGNSLRQETMTDLNQTNSVVSGVGSGGGSSEDESTASRLTSLGGRGRGNIRQQLPIGQHDGMPIIRPISGPITRPQSSGTAQTSNSGSISIRPAAAKTGSRHKAARTSDDLPFASGALALCCALLCKKHPYRALRRILLHK
jgi:parallel beta-helix repeat protein/predicted outer membrane repeat protein